MIAPFSAPASGGRGVLDFVNDFLSEQQRMALLDEQAGTKRATQNSLNTQSGYDQGVDPFLMQDFTGKQNEQGYKKTAFNNTQADRQTQLSYIENLLGGLREQPGYTNDPLLGSILKGGNSIDAVNQFMGQAGEDRKEVGAMNRAVAGNTSQARSAMALAEYKAQLDAQQKQSDLQVFMDAISSGNRLPLQSRTAMKAAESGDSETVQSMFSQARGDKTFDENQVQKAKQQEQNDIESQKLREQFAIIKGEKSIPADQEAARRSDEIYRNLPPGSVSPLGGMSEQGIQQKFESLRQKEKEQTKETQRAFSTAGESVLEVILKLIEGASNVKG